MSYWQLLQDGSWDRVFERLAVAFVFGFLVRFVEIAVIHHVGELRAGRRSRPIESLSWTMSRLPSFVPFALALSAIELVGLLEPLAVVTLYLSIRLAVALPCAEQGCDHPLAESWRLTFGSFWRTAGALYIPVLVLIPLAVPLVLLHEHTVALIFPTVLLSWLGLPLVAVMRVLVLQDLETRRGPTPPRLDTA